MIRSMVAKSLRQSQIFEAPLSEDRGFTWTVRQLFQGAKPPERHRPYTQTAAAQQCFRSRPLLKEKGSVVSFFSCMARQKRTHGVSLHERAGVSPAVPPFLQRLLTVRIRLRIVLRHLQHMHSPIPRLVPPPKEGSSERAPLFQHCIQTELLLEVQLNAPVLLTTFLSAVVVLERLTPTL